MFQAFLFFPGMRRLLHIFVVPFLLTWSHQYTIIDDNNNGLITKTFREIYLQNHTIFLNFYINTSIFHEMTSNTTFLNACMHTKILMPKSQPIPSNITKTIRLECHFIDRIKKLYLETIENNSTKNCEEIQNLIFRFDIALKRLKNPNITAIFETIPIKELKSQVQMLTKNGNNSIILPYQFNDNFTENFFNHTKMTVYKDINNINILFKIPTYQSTNLYSLLPKPFLIDNKPFIYNLGQAYFAKTPYLTIFPINLYKKNCFYIKRQKLTFCKNISTVRNCDHDMLMYNKINLDSPCFTKLPLTNYITKNIFDFYFNIRSPLNINITCSNKTEHLHIDKSINILQINNCTLQVENLKINSNKTDEYQIFALANKDFQEPQNILRFFFLFILLFFLIPNLIFVSAVTLYSYIFLPENDDNSTYMAFASTILESSTSTQNHYRHTLV